MLVVWICLGGGRVVNPTEVSQIRVETVPPLLNYVLQECHFVLVGFLECRGPDGGIKVRLSEGYYTPDPTL